MKVIGMSNSELTHYFPHDSNARSDDKMLALRSSLGNKAYALYFMVLELMREEEDYGLKADGTLIDRLSMELNEEKDFIEDFLDKCKEIELFRIEDDKLISEEFLRRMAHKDDKSRQARKAANKRWHGDSNGDEEKEQCDRNADAKHSDASRNANKKEKEKENKKETNNNGEQSSTPYSEIINYLNKKADRNFKLSIDETREKIKVRFDEGFELEDFKNVIDTKVVDWKDDNEMQKYLRPGTLFSDKFEGYLNEEKPKDDDESSEGFRRQNITEKEKEEIYG